MTRQVPDLEVRASRIELLESEMKLAPHDLSVMVEAGLWQRYWHRRDEIESLLFAAQQDAIAISEQISTHLGRRRGS